MSTEILAGTAGSAVVTPDESVPEQVLEGAWELSPSVALRPEPFGALAYHFGNRRLTFLKRPELVDVVRRLAACPHARAALIEGNVPTSQWRGYAAALTRLASAGIIRPRGEDRVDDGR